MKEIGQIERPHWLTLNFPYYFYIYRFKTYVILRVGYTCDQVYTHTKKRRNGSNNLIIETTEPATPDFTEVATPVRRLE